MRSKRFGIPREAKSVRYPIRLLRYWFGYHLLREEAQRWQEAHAIAAEDSVEALRLLREERDGDLAGLR